MAVEQAQHSSPFVNNPWTVSPTGRSYFGKQADSKKSSAPTYSFNSPCTRDQSSKMYLSQNHIEVDNKCREGPGHIYSLPSALSKQVEGTKVSAPSYSFSHNERLKSIDYRTPGPGIYKTLSSMGDQPVSTKKSPEKFRFGKSHRQDGAKMFLTSDHITHTNKGLEGAPPGTYPCPGAMGMQSSSMKKNTPSYSMAKSDKLRDRFVEASKFLPPVGQYDTWYSIGKQAQSTYRTMPSYGFAGCSSWEKEERRFLTSDHSASLKGTASPNNYDHQRPDTLSSLNKQVLSGRSNTPSYGFGSSPKQVFKTSNTPGPGSYD